MLPEAGEIAFEIEDDVRQPAVRLFQKVAEHPGLAPAKFSLYQELRLHQPLDVHDDLVVLMIRASRAAFPEPSGRDADGVQI